jgi:hypothetical protein
LAGVSGAIDARPRIVQWLRLLLDGCDAREPQEAGNAWNARLRALMQERAHGGSARVSVAAQSP